MQSIHIDGTYTYVENIKALRIGENIKLIANTSNRLNSDAIGAYTLSGKKIGYVPFKSNQIDINGKYIVSKINLTQSNPILLISRDFETSNFIKCTPPTITKLKNQTLKFIDGSDELNNDLKKFGKFLQNSGHVIRKIGICEFDDSFITICIQTQQLTNVFYTVTKKYYDENIFKYDEFYKFGLIAKCIYQPFQIHRLEKYLELNYKPIEKLVSMKKLKFPNLLESGIFDPTNLDNLSGLNCGFEHVESSGLITIDKKYILDLPKLYIVDFIKLMIQYSVEPIELYNPANLLSVINIKKNIKNINLDNLINMFDGLKIGGISYNHKIKAYCSIDLVDPINIVEISNCTEITQKYFTELLLKLVIADKQIINVYNPISGSLYRIEISDRIKNNILNLILN